MDRLLLDSNWNDGYPLCLETLQLLQNNVQLLETVLNGFDLPDGTVVRFPAVNGVSFAYVKKWNAGGEILQIGTGASIDNASVTGYSITSTDIDIVDSTNHPYPDVYQERRLTLSTGVVATGPQSGAAKVYDFSEVVETALWQSCGLNTVMPYRDSGGNDMSGYVTGTPVIKVKRNDRELRIKICMEVQGLPLASDSEFQIVFYDSCLDDDDDDCPVWAHFKSSSLQQHVSAVVRRFDNSNSHRFVMAIATHELYATIVGTGIPVPPIIFTGQITVNAVIVLNQTQDDFGGGISFSQLG
jgi:hypothetical protein